MSILLHIFHAWQLSNGFLNFVIANHIIFFSCGDRTKISLTQIHYAAVNSLVKRIVLDYTDRFQMVLYSFSYQPRKRRFVPAAADVNLGCTAAFMPFLY